MTLETIVIPLRLKQKKNLPSWTGMHCVSLRLIFVFDWRRISGHAAVTGWHRQPFVGTKTSVSPHITEKWVDVKAGPKACERRQQQRAQPLFSEGRRRAEVGWGSRWTPRPHGHPHHRLLRPQGSGWTFPSWDRTGAGSQATQFPTIEHACHLPSHVSCSQMTCITSVWTRTRKNGRRNACSHRDRGLQVIDLRSPIRKGAS